MSQIRGFIQLTSVEHSDRELVLEVQDAGGKAWSCQTRCRQRQ
ncbi:MAG: hypothetical protein QXL00_02025 [Conexivisphaerales archaeon]